MSNDDERMDRAKRIREMREGSREGDSDDAETADGGKPPDQQEDDTDQETVADAEEESEASDEDDGPATDAETESDASDGDDGDEKQTMEDLVESAAADADEEDEDEGLELDDDLSVDEDLEEMDPTAEEEAVVAEVADAVMDDDHATAESDPDDGAEMKATDDAADAATVEDEPDPASEDDEAVTAPLPDTDTLEDALEGTSEGDDVETVTPEDDEEMPAAPGTETDESETQEDETRVLEFRLDDEYYCLDIQYIEEIVKEETITRVPNTPEFVQGVVDLRGQITTILNPKVTLGKDSTEADQLIVVFDAEAFEDQGHIGWVVDDVRQVSPITDNEVNDPPIEEEYINGVIDREDEEQFVIWTSPDLALEEADG